MIDCSGWVYQQKLISVSYKISESDKDWKMMEMNSWDNIKFCARSASQYLNKKEKWEDGDNYDLFEYKFKCIPSLVINQV
jgi:hypothetical protein